MGAGRLACMAQKADGMNYAPQGKPSPVVKAGDFVFAAAYLEHGHIYGQCNGLIEAGAELKWVYDADPKKVEAFRAKFPQVQVARSFDEILADPAVRLVAAAAVPSERGAIGCRVMQAGKDYFTDKTPFTTLDQLATARTVAATTGVNVNPTSFNTTVTAAAAASVTLVPGQQTTTSGGAVTYTLGFQDQYGNTAAYAGTATITYGGAAVDPASPTSVTVNTATNQTSFTVTTKQSGTATVTFSSSRDIGSPSVSRPGAGRRRGRRG